MHFMSRACIKKKKDEWRRNCRLRFVGSAAVREKKKNVGRANITRSKTCVFRLVLALQSEEHLRPILAQKVSG